jgi:hypothetical protein
MVASDTSAPFFHVSSHRIRNARFREKRNGNANPEREAKGHFPIGAAIEPKQLNIRSSAISRLTARRGYANSFPKNFIIC